jgi:hypothetical protein
MWRPNTEGQSGARRTLRSSKALAALHGLFCVAAFLLLPSCGLVSSPETEKANVILDGELDRVVGPNGQLSFEGWVKNIGEGTAFNIEVWIDVELPAPPGGTSTGYTKGYLGEFVFLHSGERASFYASASWPGVTSFDQIGKVTTRITWSDLGQ